MNTLLIIIFVLFLILCCSIWLIIGIEEEDWVEIGFGIVGLIILISITLYIILSKGVNI
jgi:hypothetical protein